MTPGREELGPFPAAVEDGVEDHLHVPVRSRGMVNRFDAIVVGAGPAGSVSALCLARAGAKVLLLDRVKFPRDKACGDLLSPLAIRELAELDVVTDGSPVGGMQLTGESGRSMSLPWPKGASYPSHAESIPRLRFDDQLRLAALEAGAEMMFGDFETLELDTTHGVDVRLREGTRLSASFVVGADGSLSQVAEQAGLLLSSRALWGFALRYYAPGSIDAPHIIYAEQSRGRAFPGFGWIFPGEAGHVNVGLGASLGGSREGAGVVSSFFPRFATRLRELELLSDEPLSNAHRRGGWLRMGSAGTVPAHGRVLLVGDAAGLINPLAGEGISGALFSARAAARAIASAAEPARSYREELERRHAPFFPSASALQAFMGAHSRVFALTGSVLTAPGIRTALGPVWSMYWNDLLDGAPRSSVHAAARALRMLGQAATVASKLRRETARTLSSTADRYPDVRVTVAARK